ncbi:hypothetical protein HK102_005508 [Quaeritorhiza haematococci]|nr:hypothetical protein HK102_005508 [Quaeritorhiza haematococci]
MSAFGFGRTISRRPCHGLQNAAVSGSSLNLPSCDQSVALSTRRYGNARSISSTPSGISHQPLSSTPTNFQLAANAFFPIQSRSFSSTSAALSKIARRPLKYPNDVSIAIAPYTPTPSFPKCKLQAVVKGPKGELAMPLQPFVELRFPGTGKQLRSESKEGVGASKAATTNASSAAAEQDPKQMLEVWVEDSKDRKQRAMWGTTWRLLNNMVEGVTEGFTVPLRLVGVGYRALFEDGRLSLKLGYSHPILMDIPKGVEVAIPAPQRIILQGIDLQQVTQFAAKIRTWRPPEPYNQKGIFVGDETIKKKEGKKR